MHEIWRNSWKSLIVKLLILMWGWVSVSLLQTWTYWVMINCFSFTNCKRRPQNHIHNEGYPPIMILCWHCYLTSYMRDEPCPPVTLQDFNTTLHCGHWDQAEVSWLSMVHISGEGGYYYYMYFASFFLLILLCSITIISISLFLRLCSQFSPLLLVSCPPHLITCTTAICNHVIY